ncbi:MAG: T9SS type A sorting domain-containing protein, partial [Chlorobi bacterium]|nr:T9SS type A sorting domain-containing protein [Chlorobiota bacterium]
IENKTISDTILIRFNFISDNINTGKEGWMIDDIRLYNVDLGGNIKTLSNPKHSVIQTNPIQDKSLVVFDKPYPFLTVQLFDFQGKLLLNQKLYNTKTFMFNRNNLPEGMYFLKLNFNNQFSETQKLIIAN